MELTPRNMCVWEREREREREMKEKTKRENEKEKDDFRISAEKIETPAHNQPSDKWSAAKTTRLPLVDPHPKTETETETDRPRREEAEGPTSFLCWMCKLPLLNDFKREREQPEMSSTSIPTTFPVAGGKQQCHRVRLNGNSNSTQVRESVSPARFLPFAREALVLSFSSDFVRPQNWQLKLFRFACLFRTVQSQRKKVPAVPGLQNFGRVDHYFQSHSQNSEQQHGSEFLKQLFQYPHSSCIAVQGGGTEGYVVNRAFITEAQQTQAKLLEMVQSLQRENEKLKSNKV